MTSLTPDAATPAPVRRGARKYAIATLVAQFCALGRYMILARMLGPVDLGLAATLIIAAQFFEQVTDGGSDRFLVQHRDGNSPAALRLAHLYATSRGLLVAVSLVLLAGPLARFFGQPQLAWGFVLLAIYPAIFAFRHLDYRRVQREHDFRAESSVVLYGELAGLAGTALGVYLLHDFTAIALGLALRAAVMVVLTHHYAAWRYAIGNSPSHLAALRRFAAPLMLNGAIVFAATQGDRVLIGKLAGIEQLGLYSATILLIYYPLAMIQRWLASISFPALCAAQDRPVELRRVAAGLGDRACVIGIAAMWGFALIGAKACELLFGAQFAQSAWLVGLIAIFQMLRFLRVWPTNVALGTGSSRLVLASNLTRLIALPAAWALSLAIEPLTAIVTGFAFGEFAALAVAIWSVNRGAGAPITHGARRIGVVALAVCAVLLGNYAAMAGSYLAWAGTFSAVALTLALLRRPIAVLLRELSAEAAGVVRRP